jgi:MFS family permease
MKPVRRMPRSLPVAVGGLLAFAAVLATEPLLAPRLGPADHMVSEYANAGGLAGAAAVAALSAWALSLLAAAQLASLAADRAGSRATWVLVAGLLAAAVGVAVAAAFPTQAVRGVVPPGVERTTAGRLHDLGGGLAQAALFAAALATALAGRWPWRLRLLAAAAVVVAAISGPLLTAVDAGARGLRQRGAIAAACAWELGLVWACARREAAGPAAGGGAD